MQRKVPEGVKVRTTHLRRIGGNVPVTTQYFETHDAKVAGHILSDRGGLTQVELVKDDVVIAVGESRCSDKEKFSRKIGRDIAIGRALKALDVAEP